MQPLRVRGDLEVIAMKGYSTFPKSLRLEARHLIVQCHIQDIGINKANAMNPNINKRNTQKEF